MKNKTLISFCVNLLIGVLFSFPIFSFQSIGNHHQVSVLKYSVFTGVESIQSNTDTDANTGLTTFYNKTSTQRYLDRNYFPGNKDNSHSDVSYNPHREHHPKIISTNTEYLFLNFVNISYLKELRNTKMLC